MKLTYYAIGGRIMLVFDGTIAKDERKQEEYEDFKRYRKKILIRAKQMHKDFMVKTLEGNMTAKTGDYLAIGVEGELYPIQKKIFEKTYELVE